MEQAQKRRRVTQKYPICLSKDEDEIWVATFLDLDLDPVGALTREEAIEAAVYMISTRLAEHGCLPKRGMMNPSTADIQTIEPNMKHVIESNTVTNIYLDRL